MIWAPWEVTDPAKQKVPLSFLLQGGTNAAGQNYPIAYAPSGVGSMTPNGYFCITTCAQQGNTTPLTSFADTLSWNKGKHAFKGGIEMIYTHSTGTSTADKTIPNASGGNSAQNPVTAFANTATFPGLLSSGQTTAQQLLAFMSGSVASASQEFFIQSPNQLDHWLNYLDKKRRVVEPHENEMTMFFKDNWKIRPSFTLNAGIRWSYYGVPYEGQGLTIRPAGGHTQRRFFKGSVRFTF